MYDIVIELYFANVDIFYLKEAIIINDSENKINLDALTEQFASTNLPPYFKHFFLDPLILYRKLKKIVFQATVTLRKIIKKMFIQSIKITSIFQNIYIIKVLNPLNTLPTKRMQVFAQWE